MSIPLLSTRARATAMSRTKARAIRILRATLGRTRTPATAGPPAIHRNELQRRLRQHRHRCELIAAPAAPRARAPKSVSSGLCTVSCTSPLVLCGRGCVDTNSDPDHCRQLHHRLCRGRNLRQRDSSDAPAVQCVLRRRPRQSAAMLCVNLATSRANCGGAGRLRYEPGL